MRLYPIPPGVLALVLAAAAFARQAPADPAAKPSAPTPAAQAPKTVAKDAPVPKKPAKPASKAVAGSKSALKPEVAAQANVRSQMLKQRARLEPRYKGPKTDLNGASKEALMKLPGITAALADKIIAGRPYKTKAHLITHDVLPYAVYEPIKDRILAKQNLASPAPAPRK